MTEQRGAGQATDDACGTDLPGDPSCGEVTDGVGNVFEVDGSIDDRHDGAAGEVVAEDVRGSCGAPC